MTKTTVSKNQYADSRDFMTSLLFRKWTIAIYGIDRFTSSREGIVSDDALFRELLEDIKPVVKSIIDQWDKWRIEIKQDGDNDNPRFSQKERASKKLYNETVNEYKPDLPDNSEPIKRIKNG